MLRVSNKTSVLSAIGDQAKSKLRTKQDTSRGRKNLDFKKLCLTSGLQKEYIYGPEAGSLKVYEKSDTRFLLHLL